MESLVPQKNLPSTDSPFILLRLLANVAINAMVVVVAFADLATWIYQEIYFTINHIPKIKRSSYVIITRHRLKGLSPMQKWSCWYCEYVNGTIAWVKAVANQTEVYSCAIKCTHAHPGQEYQQGFYRAEEFSKKSGA